MFVAMLPSGVIPAMDASGRGFKSRLATALYSSLDLC